MKTDGKFGYIVSTIPAKYNNPLNIIFLGDVHFNSPNFAHTSFVDDMQEISALVKRENVYFILTGDIFEAMSTSERHHFEVGGKGGFHESNKSRWEKEYLREIDLFLKYVPFLKNRTLAVFGGNHFFKFYDGTTSDMVLASKLNAPYIGCSGYVIARMKMDTANHVEILKIFVHHGKSSGKRAGGTFNALEDAAGYFVDAQVVVMGHDHKAGAMILPALKCSEGRGGHYNIVHFNKIIGRSGSYLKAYEPNVPSYAVDAMMRPSTLGYLHIIVNPSRKCYNEKGIDERVVKLNAKV